MNIIDIKSTFKNKKVLITGNTGFKGSWLSLMMYHLGAKVYGLSNKNILSKQEYIPITTGEFIEQHISDIRDYNQVFNIINDVQPDFIFHLAANAITLASYESPLETFHTNSMGTAYILEAVRQINKPCNVIVVSSDKCYENKKWVWGYRETDHLAGSDPYSASKSIAELITKSYFHSYFEKKSNIQIASCRAGNVIGGGDWSQDRIVPDCIKLWKNQQPLFIRNPSHIRPWNYVLDVLWGYILTAYHLNINNINGEAFNFGPNINQAIDVEQLVNILWNYWPDKSFKPYIISENASNEGKEHEILKLNSDKAFAYLQWSPKMNIQEGLSESISWYLEAQHHINNIDAFSLRFIYRFFNHHP